MRAHELPLVRPGPHEPRAHLTVFSATLAAAVGLVAFPSFAFGVLAPFLRDEFGLSRSELGLLTMVLFISAAPASLVIGKIVDAVGGRKMMAAIFVAVASTTLGMALAPSYPWLLLVSALSGIPLALGNPVTNKLIARHVSTGARGVVTGVKQSGVQIAAFLAGAVLPAAARAWGWRTAVGLGAVAAALGLVGTLSIPSSERLPRQERPNVKVDAVRGLKALAIYAFLMGSAMSAIVAYLPLYAEERIGLSVGEAGAVASTIGLMGIFSRIFWGWRSERYSHMSLPLVIMSVGAMVATSLIVLASSVGGWTLWPAAVLIGATAAAWMAVGMLAIVNEQEGETMGRASGLVIFGYFCGGLASPLLFGYSVDATGSYVPGWLGVLIAFGLASLIASLWRRAWLRDLP